MKIRIYGHTGNKPHIANIPIQDIEKCREKLSHTLVASVKDADLVLGHFNDMQIRQNIECTGDFKQFPARQIVVFVTTTPGYTTYESKKVSAGNDEKYLLFVRDMSIVAKPQILERVLSLNPDHASHIISQGALSLGWPQDPFAIDKSPLLPLAILCQGYLAAYAQSAKASIPEEIKPILQQIGWNENLAISNPNLANLASKISEVSQASWWQKAMDKEQLQKLVAVAKAKKLSQVERLLDSLQKDNLDQNQLPQMIAKAYDELRANLIDDQG